MAAFIGVAVGRDAARACGRKSDTTCSNLVGSPRQRFPPVQRQQAFLVNVVRRRAGRFEAGRSAPGRLRMREDSPGVEEQDELERSNGAAPTTSHEQLSAEARQLRIEEQLRFWFSVPNLKRDWYLRSRMAKDGWIRAEVFTRFNSIRGLQVDDGDVLAAFQRLGGAVAEVDLAARQVRPQVEPGELTRDYADERSRSVFLLGVQDSDDVLSIKQRVEELEKVLYVVLGRQRNRQRKGWALVELESKEAVRRVLGGPLSADDDDDAWSSSLRAVSVERFEELQGGASAGHGEGMGILHVRGVPADTSFSELSPIFHALDAAYLNYVEGDAEFLLRVRNTRAAMRMFEEDGVSVRGERLDAEALNTVECARYWRFVNEGSVQFDNERDDDDPKEDNAVGRIMPRWARSRGAPVARDFAAAAVGRPRDALPTVLELHDVPASLSWQKAREWIREERLSVPFLRLDAAEAQAVLFFRSNADMERFVQRLDDNGGNFAGESVRYRRWSVEEEREEQQRRLARREERRNAGAAAAGSQPAAAPYAAANNE